MDQVTQRGYRPGVPSHRDEEMQSAANQDAVFDRQGGKAQSTAKSLIKSVRSKHEYSAKAWKKIKKLLASGSRKAQTVMSRQARDAGRADDNQEGSCDDGRVGAWATGHEGRVDYPGDADGDTIMGDSAMEFDHRSYPPLSSPQNMNALVQHWGEPVRGVCQMAVSDCSSNSSSASVFSGSELDSRCSTPSLTNRSTPEGDNRRTSLLGAGVNRLREDPPPTEEAALKGPFWVDLHQGFNTKGQRVCWAQGNLKQRTGPRRQRQGTVPRRHLQLLEQYELTAKTNQHWLLKGIRFERIDLYRQEFQGPAALLTVFRDHERKPGAPFHMNVQGPIRIGRVNLRPPAQVASNELAYPDSSD